MSTRLKNYFPVRTVAPAGLYCLFPDHAAKLGQNDQYPVEQDNPPWRHNIKLNSPAFNQPLKSCPIIHEVKMRNADSA